uniref:Uncharacterized protein n=1 Tax=Cannabis sativa TaxID=3483 RepID=A0A803NK02_CANSA
MYLASSKTPSLWDQDHRRTERCLINLSRPEEDRRSSNIYDSTKKDQRSCQGFVQQTKNNPQEPRPSTVRTTTSIPWGCSTSVDNGHEIGSPIEHGRGFKKQILTPCT